MNETMMKMVTVNYDSEQPTVLGRDLHEALGIDSNYTTWFKRMCEYGFEEGKDYITCFPNLESEKQHGGQNKIDHQITIPMAKEICMIQRTDIGRRYRQYFIALEEKWNSPELVMARALKLANVQIQDLQTVNKALLKTNEQQERVITEMKPKAEYAEKILQSKETLATSQIAEDYGMTAQAMNKCLERLGIQYKRRTQWLLYAKYKGKGYTDSYTYCNDQSQAFVNTVWTQKGRMFVYEQLKAINILPTIERN